MAMLDLKGTDFIRLLSSSEPVPGGGGASAAVGALAAALGMMVCNLTMGKKKYAAWEDDIRAACTELEALRDDLIQKVDADAQAFEPLSRAYGLPRDTEDQKADRARIMEEALVTASQAPLDLMRTLVQTEKALEILVEKGSRLAVSDVGVAIVFAQAALEGASLNVYINTKLMADRDRAAGMEAEADALIQTGAALKDRIFAGVTAAIRPDQA
jgi:formiminotetrahydrofolate cyclodeaminase